MIDVKQKALELDYKIFHKDHFYPGKETLSEVLEEEIARIVYEVKPKRGPDGKFIPTKEKND